MGHLFYILAPEYDFLIDLAACDMKAISGAACLEGQLQAAAGTSAACLSIEQTSPTVTTRKEEGISLLDGGSTEEESLTAMAAGADPVSQTEDPFLNLLEELLSFIMRKCSPDAFLAAWQVNQRWRAIASEEAAPLFNAKPRQGIAFLMRTQKFRTPEDVARFLLRGRDLNRNLIGEYLGDRTPRCDQILRAYLHLFDFTGLEIDDALQAFLEKGLVLPTLSHKVRRILRRFGERYLEGNPGVDMGVDAAEDLAMCLVELRTILDVELGHTQPNPRGKERVLKWVYVRLPANFLGQLYDRMVDRLLAEKASKRQVEPLH